MLCAISWHIHRMRCLSADVNESCRTRCSQVNTATQFECVGHRNVYPQWSDVNLDGLHGAWVSR